MTISARNTTIDILKGICIILMVIGHSEAPLWLGERIYMFHMPCFFIISGYLFKEKYLADIKSFIIRKMNGLWKPYVIWTLLFIALHNIFAELHFYKDTYTLSQHIKYAAIAFLMRPSQQLLGGFWFLVALFYASILSIVWYKIVRFSKKWILTGAIIMTAISISILFIESSTLHSFYLVFLATAYFMLGTWLRLFLSTDKIINKKLQSAIITAAIILLAVGPYFIQGNMLSITASTLLPYFITSSTISMSLIIICSYIPPSTPINWLTKIGERTLDILIFHFLAFKAISFIKIIHYGYDISRLSDFPVIMENNSFYWLLYSIVGILGSLLLASAIRLPVRKISNHWKKLRFRKRITKI